MSPGLKPHCSGQLTSMGLCHMAAHRAYMLQGKVLLHICLQHLLSSGDSTIQSCLLPALTCHAGSSAFPLGLSSGPPPSNPTSLRSLPESQPFPMLLFENTVACIDQISLASHSSLMMVPLLVKPQTKTRTCAASAPHCIPRAAGTLCLLFRKCLA